MAGHPDQATIYVTPSSDGGSNISCAVRPPAFDIRGAGMQELGFLQFNWKTLIRSFLTPLVSALLKEKAAERITAHVTEKYDKDALTALLQERGVECVVEVVIEATVAECAQLV